MSLRLEFVTLAKKENVNIRSLCKRFDISPETGYKWLG
jgi:transposase-like protein